MTRPRVADDFSTIRGRMDELRRERVQVLAEARSRSVIHSRPFIVLPPKAASQPRQFAATIVVRVGDELPSLITS